MNNLPTKSLSKSVLIATPLFCLVIALLDSSDQLSYLFVLSFLGNVAGTADLTYIPTLQPQIRTSNFQRDSSLNRNGINQNIPAYRLPLVQTNLVKQWADRNEVIRGFSPRWIIPIQMPRTDGLLMVLNTTREKQIGVGLKSNLQKLAPDEVALSEQLIGKLDVKVGDKIKLKWALADIFSGGKLLQKYQTVASKQQFTVQQQNAFSLDGITQLVYKQISQRLPQDQTLQKQTVRQAIQVVYNISYENEYKVKYVYKNNGLVSSALHNIVLMEFQGFADMVYQLIKTNIIFNKQLQKAVFDGLKQANLTSQQLVLLKLQLASLRSSSQTQTQIYDQVLKSIYDYPLMVGCTLKQRQLLYHPNKQNINRLQLALQTAPGDFQMISVYPFFKDLAGIRYFFKSVIQIFSFVCAVIYFYIMILILKRIYEDKAVQVGIWRTLGAGGVKMQAQQAKLAKKLSLKQKLQFAYQVIVKVGFLYYWLTSAVVSTLLYIVAKNVIYEMVSNGLGYDSPPWSKEIPFIIFLAVFFFPICLGILHLRQIYIQPLATTIKPIKRTFDIVKVRIIKLATFGITIDVLVIAIMLVYYGFVSYYAIPYAILNQQLDLQTTLFNSIFVFMIFGAIMLIGVMQARMEYWLVKLVAFISRPVKKTQSIILKSIRAGQYKNIKVAIVISIIFAFLLFFSAGLKIQAVIVKSFIERQLGAQMVLQNYQENTFNRPEVQAYLNKVGGVKYSWLSQDLDNRRIKMQFNSIVLTKPVTSIFKVATASYLDTTYFSYYYPQFYMQEQKKNYQVLPNGIYNGYNSLYLYDGKYNNISTGKYDPSDTMTTTDPHHINIGGPKSQMMIDQGWQVAPQEQIINIAATTILRRFLGATAGDLFKLKVSNQKTGLKYIFRCRVTHALKIGPGIDLFSKVAFISQQQANYIYRVMGRQGDIKYQRLFITGQNLRPIGNKIVSMSPQHTQLFEMSMVSQAFEFIEDYLTGFIFIVTIILASLSALFLSVYTYNKCKQEALSYKMLRAIGLSVSNLRFSIFLQIFIRLFVSISNGIILGAIFSVMLAGQIQDVLLINTPQLQMQGIFLIAFILLILFSLTVAMSTRYLAKTTVLQTDKA